MTNNSFTHFVLMRAQVKMKDNTLCKRWACQCDCGMTAYTSLSD